MNPFALYAIPILLAAIAAAFCPLLAILGRIAVTLEDISLLLHSGALRGPAGPAGPAGTPGRDGKDASEMTTDAGATPSGDTWQVLKKDGDQWVLSHHVRKGTQAYEEAYTTPGLALRQTENSKLIEGVQ